jgi:hypothetical protein
MEAQFPTNGTGTIGANRVRTYLGTDIPDSFINNVDDFQLFVEATGANAYSLAGQIAAYATGFMAIVKIATTSTGACTLNVNTIGAKKIFKDQATQAGSGDLVANQIYLMIYDTALDGGAGGFLVMGNASAGVSSRVSFDTSGAAPVMDMGNQTKRTFVGTVPIDNDAELSFSNASQMVEATTFIEIDGSRLITIPANVLINTSMWTWTKPATKFIWNAEEGVYRLEWRHDGTNMHLEIYGPYSSTL